MPHYAGSENKLEEQLPSMGNILGQSVL